MREIKFRGWNGKQMVYQPAITVDEDGLEWKWGDLMQFTGLLDKSGKEIYEGDILRHTTSPEKTYYEVKFGKFEGRMEYYMEGFNGFVEDFERFEVIGNIFSNPELLK